MQSGHLKVFEDFKSKILIRIAWIDMDIQKHVNSSKYFTYFESARIKYLEDLDFFDYFTAENISVVISRTECNYYLPLTYPDNIAVGARVTEMKEDSLVMEYFINSDSSGLSATGEAELVFVDLVSSKKILIPEFVKNKIKKFEQFKLSTK